MILYFITLNLEDFQFGTIRQKKKQSQSQQKSCEPVPLGFGFH